MSRKAALWHWSLLSSHVEVRRMCLGSGLRHLRDNILPLGNATGKRLWVIPCPVPEVRCVYENECAAKSLSRSWLFAFKTWWLCVCTNAVPGHSLKVQSADCMLEHGTQPTGSPHRKRPLHCCSCPPGIQPLLQCCFRVSGACHISPPTHTRTKARRPFARLHLALVFVWIGRGSNICLGPFHMGALLPIFLTFLFYWHVNTKAAIVHFCFLFNLL